MGESNNPGTCQASSCPQYGQDLETCECEDGRHPAQLEAKKEAERNPVAH